MKATAVVLLVLCAAALSASTPIDQKPLASGFVSSVNRVNGALYAGNTDPQPGDNVSVRIEKIGNSYIDRKVTVIDAPLRLFISGTVEAKNGSVWTIAGFSGTIDASTVIHGTINAGDKVLVIADRFPNDGSLLARDIQKDPRPW